MKALYAMVVALTLGVTTQAEPRNVRLRVQEADTLTGRIQWVQPQERGSPPLTGYEYRVAVDGLVTVTGSGPASERSVDFALPFACGDTLALLASVRATGPWPAPGPWAASDVSEHFKPCPVVPAGPPVVDLVVDTLATPPDTTTPPPDPPDPPPDPLPDTVPPDFFDDFSSGDLSKSNAFFRWGNGTFTNVRQFAADSTNWTLRFNYNCAIEPDATNAEQRFVLLTPSKVVALRWMEYYATGQEADNGTNPLGYHHRNPPSGPDNNKYIRLWGDNYSALDKVGASTRPIGGGSESLFVETTNSGGTGGGSIGVNPWVTVPADLGRWREVRMLFKYASSPTANDGVIQVWLDGVLAGGSTTLANMHDPASAVQAYQNGYLRGWPNAGCDRDPASDNTRMRVWYDDFAVWLQDPGW